MFPYINIPPLKLGPLTFYPFGILVAIGLLLGARVAIGFGVRQRNLDRGVMADLVAWIAIGGMIGGHVLQVIFYRPQEVLRAPWTLLYIWSGLSSFGGFIGAFVAFLVWLRRRQIGQGGQLAEPPASRGRRRRGKDSGGAAARESADGEAPRGTALAYADSIGFGLVFGWIFGRSGCTVAHDHPGRLSDFVLAVKYPRGARHDLGLYELLFTSLVLAPVMLIMQALERRRGRPYPDGAYLAVISVLYAPVRFGLDFLRATDMPVSDARYFALTPAQYGALALLAYGLYLVWRIRTEPTYTGGPALAAAAETVEAGETGETGKADEKAGTAGTAAAAKSKDDGGKK